jgi:hypothetical protein
MAVSSLGQRGNTHRNHDSMLLTHPGWGVGNLRFSERYWSPIHAGMNSARRFPGSRATHWLGTSEKPLTSEYSADWRRTAPYSDGARIARKMMLTCTVSSDPRLIQKKTDSHLIVALKGTSISAHSYNVIDNSKMVSALTVCCKLLILYYSEIGGRIECLTAIKWIGSHVTTVFSCTNRRA